MSNRQHRHLVGAQFGLLTVIRPAGTYRYAGGKRRQTIWLCRCECGQEIEARMTQLKDGKKKYCSVANHQEIFRQNMRDNAHRKHRFADKPTYASWLHAKQRCAPGGKYSKKGVRICDRWANSFDDFVADVGLRPSAQHTLDRIDTRGNYEPGNCRWATLDVQNRNKVTTVWVNYRGEQRKLVDLCEALGVKRGVVYGRLKIGWALEDALIIPVGSQGPRAKLDKSIS